MKEGRLAYNDQNDRYGLMVDYMWEYEGIRCGQLLEVMMDDGTWMPTRMELGPDGWYLVGTQYRGNELGWLMVRMD